MSSGRRQPRDEQFDQFFSGRGPALRRVAFIMVSDWQLAEDLTQQAMTKVYVHWDKSDGYRRYAFARKILVRECVSHLRSRKPEHLVAEVPERSSEDSITSAGGLLQALASLAPQQRAVIALRVYDDLSVTQVAQLLGIAEGTVKSQTSHALARLRQTTSTFDQLRRGSA